MRLTVVTSFDKAGYEQYGRKFLESWGRYEHRPKAKYDSFGKKLRGAAPFDLKANLCIWVNGLRETPVLPPGISLYDGQRDGDRAQFIGCYNVQSNNYRWQATKFANKVFAVTRQPEGDWWVWLDADVELKKPLDAKFWKAVLKGDGSYLGRKDWHHSECGWVAYRLPQCLPFLARFREVYTTGEIFEHLEWHDSYIFDRVREEFPTLKWTNLSEGVPGLDVWPQTILGEYMVHNKGAKKLAV